MSIFNPILSGAVRSIKSIKGVLVIWLSTLLLVSMLALPMKSSVKSILGSSMITEKLTDGINIDVIADFGTSLSTLMSGFRAGMFLVLFFGILLNIFFNGGLFTTLRNGEEKYSSAQFFRGAGHNFWSFLVITLLTSIIIALLGLIAFGIPQLIAGAGDSVAEGARYKAAITGSIIFVILLPVFLLVADYARVWQVTSHNLNGFKAIGVGFTQTFKNFFSSYPVMLISIAIQALFGWFVLKFLTGMTPHTGLGLFSLFLLSQFLFILKLLLRVWRYGSVTSMYEQHPAKNS